MDESCTVHVDLNPSNFESNSPFFSKICLLKQILEYVSVPSLLDPLLPNNKFDNINTNLETPLSMPSLSSFIFNASSPPIQLQLTQKTNTSVQPSVSTLKSLKILKPRIKKKGFTSKRAKDELFQCNFSPQTSRLFKLVTKISRNEIPQNISESSKLTNSLYKSASFKLRSNDEQLPHWSSRCSSRSSICSSNLSPTSSQTFSLVPSPSSSCSSLNDFILNPNFNLDSNTTNNSFVNFETSFNQSKVLPDVNKIFKYYRKQFYLAMKPLQKLELTFKTYPSYLSSCKKDNLKQNQVQTQASKDIIREARKEIEQLLDSFKKKDQIIPKQMDENGHWFFSIPEDIQELIS